MAQLRDTVVAGNLNVSNKIITQEINTTGKIWIQTASNRLTTTNGMPGDMQYGSGKRGTQIYSNGIAFADPYDSANNDAGWIRHLETVNNSGTLEIGIGDDGNERAAVRQYDGNNNITRQMLLLDNDGITKVASRSNNDSYSQSALEIREENFTGAGTDTWGRAPRLTWHWSGRTAAQIGLSSNGWLYESPGTTTNFSRIVVENGGSWNIVVPWANTNHPSTFPPSYNNFTCTLLWTNSSTTSNFASQTVTVSQSVANFKLLLIAIVNSTSAQNSQFNIVNPGITNKVSNAGYSDNAIRTVTASGTSVTFSNAQHGSSSTANGYAIPYKIWGLA